MHKRHEGPDARLEEGWTIRIKPTANIAVLTLVRPDGADAHIAFAAAGPDDVAEPTSNDSLEMIADPALRAAAGRMLADYAVRVTKATAAVEEFNRRVHPTVLESLTGWLAAQKIDAHLDLDSDTLALALVLTTDRAASGELLTLVRRWQASEGTPAEPVDVELDQEDGTLSARLSQEAAVHLLTWLNKEHAR